MLIPQFTKLLQLAQNSLLETDTHSLMERCDKLKVPSGEQRNQRQEIYQWRNVVRGRNIWAFHVWKDQKIAYRNSIVLLGICTQRVNAQVDSLNSRSSVCIPLNSTNWFSPSDSVCVYESFLVSQIFLLKVFIFHCEQLWCHAPGNQSN